MVCTAFAYSSYEKLLLAASLLGHNFESLFLGSWSKSYNVWMMGVPRYEQMKAHFHKLYRWSAQSVANCCQVTAIHQLQKHRGPLEN